MSSALPPPRDSQDIDASTMRGLESLRLLAAAQAARAPDAAARKEEFEEVNGPIINSYVTTDGKSAVVITHEESPFFWREKRRVLALVGHRRVRLEVAECDDAMWDAIWTARSTERRSDRLLPTGSRKVVADLLFTVLVMLIGAIDLVASHSGDERVSAQDRELLASTGRSAAKRLDYVHKYVERSELQTAVRYYLFGLPLGILVLATCLRPFIDDGALDSDPNRLLIAAAAGGVGSITSVMFRITKGQELRVGVGQGPFVTVVAGAFRPLIGAVFGVVLYVLVQGGLLPLDDTGGDSSLMFYTGLAFLAGFSERWAQDTILRSAPIAPSPVSTSTGGDDIGSASRGAATGASPQSDDGRGNGVRARAGDVSDQPPDSRFAHESNN